MNTMPTVALTIEAAAALKMLPNSVNKKGWVSELILDAIPRQFPGIQVERPRADLAQLVALASPLPGMTKEVISSHFARFPFLTAETYQQVIRVLLVRKASDEGLKNAESAAYGLCKQLQNGKKIESDNATTAPSTTEAERQTVNEVPESALMPYA